MLAIVVGDDQMTMITGAKRDELHYSEALSAAALLTS